MNQYHLYFLRNGQLAGADHIEAVNDDAAVRVAEGRADGRTVEVWDAHRRVRVVAPAKVVSAPR